MHATHRAVRRWEGAPPPHCDEIKTIMHRRRGRNKGNLGSTALCLLRPPHAHATSSSRAGSRGPTPNSIILPTHHHPHAVYFATEATLPSGTHLSNCTTLFKHLGGRRHTRILIDLFSFVGYERSYALGHEWEGGGLGGTTHLRRKSEEGAVFLIPDYFTFLSPALVGCICCHAPLLFTVIFTKAFWDSERRHVKDTPLHYCRRIAWPRFGGERHGIFWEIYRIRSFDQRISFEVLSPGWRV
jgi:hypothetical protein